MERLIRATTNAVVAALEGVDDILTAFRVAVKTQIVGTLQDVGDIGEAGLEEVAAMTTGTIHAAVGTSLVDASKASVREVTFFFEVMDCCCRGRAMAGA